MNKAFLLPLLLILAFTFCNEPKKNSIKEVGTPTLRNKIDSILPLIQGVWLPKEYVDTIIQYKSAFQAYKFIPEIAEIQIKTADLQKDTIEVISSLNNHEGYGFKIWFEENNDTISIRTNAKGWESEKFKFEFKIKINHQDTTLQLIATNYKTKIENITEYSRILNENRVVEYGGCGYEFIANYAILTGEFKLLDSINDYMGVITFDPHKRTVTGFKYDNYSIYTDYGSGLMYQGDHIYFSTQEEDHSESETFVYIQKSDTIQLYNTKEVISENDFEIKLNEKIYSLVKVSNQ